MSKAILIRDVLIEEIDEIVKLGIEKLDFSIERKKNRGYHLALKIE